VLATPTFTATLTQGPDANPLAFPVRTVKIGFLDGSDGDEDQAPTMQLFKNYYINNDASHYSTSDISNLGTDLANLDLAIIWFPKQNFSDADITAMKAFLDKGGRLYFNGENNNWVPQVNAVITDAVQRLGGSIGIQPNSFSGGVHTNSDSLIELSHSPLMSGITSFQTNLFAPVLVDPDISIPVMTDDSHRIVIADQALSKGRVTAIADLNWLENLPTYPGHMTFMHNLAVNSAQNVDLVASGGNPNTSILGPSNTAPTITAGTPSATLIEAGGEANSIPGVSTSSLTLTLSDADVGDTPAFDTAYLTSHGWTSISDGAAYTKTGLYGTATLTVATGVVNYALDNTNGNTQALMAAQSVTDTFTIQVTDGTATTTADATFTITGSNDNPVITSNGAGSTATVSAAENQTAVTTVTADDIDGYYALFGSGQNVNLSSGYQPDPNWVVVALPTGSSVTSTVPYNADVPQNVVGVYYGANTGVNGSQGGITVGDNKYFWIAPSSTTGAIHSGSYNWIVAQQFTVPQAGTYTFNFPASGDNELQFFINGAVNTADPVKPTITGGTQVGPLAGNFTTVYQFTGTATLNAVVNTAYMVLNDYGGETAALIGRSSFRSSPFVPTYTITGGDDQSLFTIDNSSGVLSFKTAPDYEIPGDADKNNSYIVQVTVGDGNGGTDVQTLTVNVTDANDAPVITMGTQSNSVVEADGGPGGSLGVATATIALTLSDPDSSDAATFDTSYMEEEEDWSTADGGKTYTNSSQYGKATLDTTTGVLSYALDNSTSDTDILVQNQTVQDTFTVTVTDGHTSVNKDVSFAVNGVNDTLTEDQDAWVFNVNQLTGGTGGIAVTASAFDGGWDFYDGSTWWDFRRITNNGPISDTNALLLPANTQIRYNPPKNLNGTADFSYKTWDQAAGTSYYAGNTTDSGFGSTAKNFSVAISPVNDAPYVTGSDTVARFDGGNDYVSLPSSHFGGEITLEAWVYPDDVNRTWQRIMEFAGPNYDASNNIILGFNSGTGQLFYYDTGIGSNIVVPSALTNHQWVHVAAVRSADKLEIYVNGQSVQTATANGAVPVLDRAHMFIAKSNYTQDNYYGGDIHDVKVWNRPLSSSEIMDSFTGKPLTGNESALLAYYPLDGRLTNLSNNPNKLGDGTLQNGAYFAQNAAAPGTVYGYEDDAFVSLAGMAIQDVDATHVRVTLSIPADPGPMTVDTTTGVTITGSNSSQITLQGSLAGVNKALDTLKLTALPANYYGNFNISYTVSDLGETGAGGELTATGLRPVVIQSVNDLPVITSLAGVAEAVVTVTENTTTVTTVQATDIEDGSALTYSISGGVDAALFAMDATSGALSFKNAPDFESPGSAGKSNGYAVQVTVTDKNGGTDVQTLTVNVADLDDNTPVITSVITGQVDENAPTSTVVYTATATDADGSVANNTVTYTLKPATGDAALLGIDPNTGDVTLNASADYETQTSYSFTVVASSSTLNSEQAVTVTVNDLDDNAPVITSPATSQVDENADPSTVIYTVTATDADITVANNTVSYSLKPDSGDVDSLNIDSVTGVVTLKASADREIKDSYSFTVVASSSALSSELPVVVSVNDLNDNTPVMTSVATGQVDENADPSTVIYTVTATDADATSPNNTLIYSLTGDDAGLLNIDPTTGAVTLKTSADYEAKASYSFTVVASSKDLSSEQAIVVSVNDLNDNTPVITSPATGNVDENAPASTVIYTVTATDADATTPNNTRVYSLKGDDAGLLNIDPTTGAVTLKTSADYETKASYSFSVVASSKDLSSVQAVVVSVNDLNDNTPVITSVATGQVDENADPSTVIYTVTATDADATSPNNTLVYSLTGDDAGLLNIDPTTGNVTLKASADREVKDSYSFTVVASSKDLSSEQAIVVSVNDLNDNAPVITSPATGSVDENADPSTVIYIVTATDADATTPNNTRVYSLKGSDAGLLNID
ncbi:MAG: cadherin domain-containing protein, partial [Methylococcaceae bacterium]